MVITVDALQTEIVASLRERGLDVFHTTPNTLEQVLESILDIGSAIGADRPACRLVSNMRQAFATIEDATQDERTPVVYCEEWSTPPMVAGNWVPDLVGIAGGTYPFCDAGERSRRVSEAAVEEAAPEHVFLHVCGAGDAVDSSGFSDRSWALPAIEKDTSGWSTIRYSISPLRPSSRERGSWPVECTRASKSHYR